jgi:hypothetical protein
MASDRDYEIRAAHNEFLDKYEELSREYDEVQIVAYGNPGKSSSPF